VVGRRSEGVAFEELADADTVQRQTDFEFAGFSQRPNTLYLRANGETGRKALYEYDLERRRRSAAVFAHPRFDVGALVHSPLDGALWAIEVDGDRPELHFFDAQAEREQALIDAAMPGTTNRIVSLDAAGRIGIVSVSGDTTPPEYYRYDRGRKQMDFLFTAYPDLDRARLAPMQPVRYAARDGLEISGYLTVPHGAEPLDLPVIVIVHDGPSGRVHWGWDPVAQFLASRGFAVFQPNYRGSTGFGREHERIGYRQWGLAMQDDLTDGVRWLVAEGIANPGRVGIYGVGYGGYAALLAVVKTPELFRAAASFGGVTDLADLLDNGAHYRSADLNQPVEGALVVDRASFEARSPARQAAHVRAPVLIGHGSADPIVHVDQARAMVSALKAAGGSVESHFYRQEQHELVDQRNRIDFHEKLADFFARHLMAIEAL
jgi:dipeptidyl aminopeptidase/acylaminoacyl peptidase